MRIALTVTYLMILTAVLVGVGCDRQDNDWAAFDPDLKIVTIVTDSLFVVEGAATQTFQVNLEMVPADTVFVDVRSDNLQVTLTPPQLQFVPIDDAWAEAKLITVTAIDDDLDEGLHTDHLSVFTHSTDRRYEGQGGPALIPVVVTDNDLAGVSISESSLTLVESELGVVRQEYRIVLQSQPTDIVTVSLGVTPAEATLHLEPETLTFDADNWHESQGVEIWIELDNIDYDYTTLTIEHTADSGDLNYTPDLAIDDLILTIFDDTLPPVARVHLVDAAVDTLKENTPTETVDVVVSLSHPSAVDVTVHLETMDKSATGGLDYLIVDQDLVFSPGAPLTQTIALTVLDDTQQEHDEEFEVVITAVENVMIGDDDRLDVQVKDNDWATLTLSVVQVDEDTGAANFVVSIPFALIVPVYFDFLTNDGTAIAGSDYEMVHDNFVLNPGETQRIIPVVIFADPNYEANETFSGRLENISDGATWPGGPAVCTIINDDPQVITFNDIVMDENTAMANFVVDLQAPYDHDVILTVNTLAGDGLGAVGGQEDAAANVDFNMSTGAGLIIPAGATTVTFGVTVANDGAAEALNEFFRLEIATASEPGFAGLVSLCTIVDDDQPCLAVADVTVDESATEAVFTVQLLNSAAAPVTSSADVTFVATTADQTAAAGDDYTAVAQGFTIVAGQPSIEIVVPLADDPHDDDAETFVLLLSDHINAEGNCSSYDPFCTIVDDEFPSVNLEAVGTRYNEGTIFTFDVMLTTQRQSETTFDIVLLPGTTGGEDIDYDFSGTGAQVIPPFTSSITFTVEFLDDQLAGEPDETFTAHISNANVALGVEDLSATIVDAPDLNVAAAAAVLEGVASEFTVTLTETSTADITFYVQHGSGLATMNDDFSAAGVGPFTIPAGGTDTVVSVPTYAADGGDYTVEDFVVTILNPINGTIGGFNSAAGTIIDGDPSELNWRGSLSAVEGTDIDLIVDLSWTSNAPITFFVQYTNGVAAGSGIDYVSANTGPFVVPANGDSIVVTVPTILDGLPELAAEDFTVSVHTLTNAVLGVAPATLAYVLDADQPELSIPSDEAALEGNALNFTVHLSEATIVPVFFELDYNTGSTQGGIDFTPNTGPFSMAAGTTDTTITVMTVEDLIFEVQEVFVVRVDNPVNAVVAPGDEALGIINDDD